MTYKWEAIAQDLTEERDRLKAALTEMLWIWDCDSVKGTFQFAGLHGCGPTPETPRIVAGIEQARAALKETT